MCQKKLERKAKQENFLHELAVGPKYTLSITGTVISFIPHPVAREIGLGLRGAGLGVGAVTPEFVHFAGTN